MRIRCIFIIQILFIHSPINFLNPRHHLVYALACAAQASLWLELLTSSLTTSTGGNKWIGFLFNGTYTGLESNQLQICFTVCMCVIHTCFAFNSSDSGIALGSCGFANLPNASLCGGANTNFGLHAWINLLYFIVSSHSVHYGTYNMQFAIIVVILIFAF